MVKILDQPTVSSIVAVPFPSALWVVLRPRDDFIVTDKIAADNRVAEA
jgi:hypothetical protein